MLSFSFFEAYYCLFQHLAINWISYTIFWCGPYLMLLHLYSVLLKCFLSTHLIMWFLFGDDWSWVWCARSFWRCSHEQYLSFYLLNLLDMIKFYYNIEIYQFFFIIGWFLYQLLMKTMLGVLIIFNCSIIMFVMLTKTGLISRRLILLLLTYLIFRNLQFLSCQNVENFVSAYMLFQLMSCACIKFWIILRCNNDVRFSNCMFSTGGKVLAAEKFLETVIEGTLYLTHCPTQ